MSSLDVRAIDETDLKKSPRPKLKQELTVFLAEEAFDRAVERGTSDTTREIGGVLVGELLRDDAGPYLKIETTIDALHAEEKGAELTFTHATWDHINKEMDTTHKGKKVVGWYHTHPGFGVFLSDRDQFIHKSFFNLPFQVAFVYDPKSKEHGLFTWRDNEVWRLRRYAVGAREHTWDGNRTEPRPAKPDDKDKKARDDERSEPKDGGEESLLGSSLATFAMIAVLLMLVAVFVGHWWGASSTNDVIRQAQDEIERARAQGVQVAVSQLQDDLVGVLRNSLGDEAMRRPVEQAIQALDATIADLQAAMPAPPAPAPAAGSGSAAPPAPPPGDPKLVAALTRVKQAREAFATLWTNRTSAMVLLDQIQDANRSGAEERVNLVHDVAEHRAAIGALYAALAAEVAKTDPVRAHGLLAAAAHVDAGNKARYEAQLQTFEKGGKLPRESGDTGNGGTP